MASEMLSFALQHKHDIWKSVESALDEQNLRSLNKIAETLLQCIKSKKAIVFMGNGGSAAEAMHLAAEFSGKCVQEHEPWLAFSLSDNTSAVTAIGNDFGFEEVFARQIHAVGSNAGLLIGMSTSGSSPNISKAFEIAKKFRITTVLMTSNKYLLNSDKNSNLIDFLLVANTNSTPRSQEIHLIWGHLLAEFAENFVE